MSSVKEKVKNLKEGEKVYVKINTSPDYMEKIGVIEYFSPCHHIKWFGLYLNTLMTGRRHLVMDVIDDEISCIEHTINGQVNTNISIDCLEEITKEKYLECYRITEQPF